MTLLSIPINQVFLGLALAFLGGVAWRRWRDRRWIDGRFGAGRVRMQSFGVGCFGLASQPGPPRRTRGFLLLLPDRLFFRSPWSGREIDIPLGRITAVVPDHRHKGVELNQSIIVIEFTSADGRPDSVAFRLPYPPQWVRAIERQRNSRTRQDNR
jgi:hypothetical protein